MGINEHPQLIFSAEIRKKLFALEEILTLQNMASRTVSVQRGVVPKCD